MDFRTLDFGELEVYLALLSAVEQRVLRLARLGKTREFRVERTSAVHFNSWLTRFADRVGLQLVLSNIHPGASGDDITMPKTDSPFASGVLTFENFIPGRKRLFTTHDQTVKALRSTFDHVRYAYCEVCETGFEQLHVRILSLPNLDAQVGQLAVGIEQVFDAQAIDTMAGVNNDQPGKPRRHHHRLSSAGSDHSENASVEEDMILDRVLPVTHVGLFRVLRIAARRAPDFKLSVKGTAMPCTDDGIAVPGEFSVKETIGDLFAITLHGVEIGHVDFLPRSDGGRVKVWATSEFEGADQVMAHFAAAILAEFDDTLTAASRQRKFKVKVPNRPAEKHTWTLVWHHVRSREFTGDDKANLEWLKGAYPALGKKISLKTYRKILTAGLEGLLDT